MNLYLLLGLTYAASPEEIEQAWRRLRSSAHPDHGGEASMFHKLKLAYEVLSDPARRAKYDETGETEVVPDDRLQQVLASLIVGAIDQCPDVAHHDLIKTIQVGVNRQLEALHQQISQLQQAIHKRRQVLKRLSRKDKTPTFILSVIEGNIADNERTILKAEAEITFHRELRDALDEFEYQADPLPVNPYAQPYGTGQQLGTQGFWQR